MSPEPKNVYIPSVPLQEREGFSTSPDIAHSAREVVGSDGSDRNEEDIQEGEGGEEDRDPSLNMLRSAGGTCTRRGWRHTSTWS